MSEIKNGELPTDNIVDEYKPGEQSSSIVRVGKIDAILPIQMQTFGAEFSFQYLHVRAQRHGHQLSSIRNTRFCSPRLDAVLLKPDDSSYENDMCLSLGHSLQDSRVFRSDRLGHTVMRCSLPIPCITPGRDSAVTGCAS